MIAFTQVSGRLGVALLLGLFLLLSHRGPPARELWLSDLSYRPLEARVSLAAADYYRPYLSGARQELLTYPFSLRQLAEREGAHDMQGIAAAYLLRSAPTQAELFLGRTAACAERENDRAVAALLQGRLEDALTLLDAALETRPGLSQAWWNRGLVLRELGLSLQSAESFGRVAALREPGWSEEAAQIALRLRKQETERAESWKSAHEAIRSWRDSLAAAPLPVSPLLEEVIRFPGTLREGFYEALRTATNREQVLRLLPLAEALDRVYGSTVMRAHLRRVVGRDFRHRAPLARDYALLLRAQHPDPHGLIARLRGSGEQDIHLGGLLHVLDAPRSSDEFQRLGDIQGDPWLMLLVEQLRAREEDTSGSWWKAERRLLSALEYCQSRRLNLPCMEIEGLLTDIYTDNNRLTEASEHARAGWSLARAAGERERESSFLQRLGQIARFRDNPASSWAFLSEALMREPDSCPLRNYVRRNLASLALSRFRVDEARRQMDLALECRLPVKLHGAATIAELNRLQPRADDEQILRRSLEQLSPGSLRPGLLLVLRLIEGRFELEHDREAGWRRLREVITQADQRPLTDMDARDARMLSYLRLLITAGRDGAFETVFSLAAEQLELAPPPRCSLVVAVEAERTVVAVRGPRGEVLGHFASDRRGPLGDDVSGLVQADQLVLLRSCERVDVLAPPPMGHRPGLLPPEMAWSYRVPHPKRPPSFPPAPRQVVVMNVEPPSHLRLARLPPWTLSPASVSRTLLMGSEATPSRLLALMPTATEIEIHAHGMLDQNFSDASLVVLAPEPSGRFALTAHVVQQVQLDGSPLVFLASCGAARLSPFLHESYSLPASFVRAGARAVFAAVADIPDSASRFFDAVRARIHAGASPAVALRNERLLWRGRGEQAAWLDTVLVFE